MGYAKYLEDNTEIADNRMMESSRVYRVGSVAKSSENWRSYASSKNGRYESRSVSPHKKYPANSIAALDRRLARLRELSQIRKKRKEEIVQKLDMVKRKISRLVSVENELRKSLPRNLRRAGRKRLSTHGTGKSITSIEKKLIRLRDQMFALQREYNLFP